MAKRTASGSARRARRAAGNGNGEDGGGQLDDVEIEARVCNLICTGVPVSRICSELATGDPPIKLKRQDPFRILHRAGQRGRLHYTATFEFTLAENLKRQYNWLHDVHVVHSAEAIDIADKASDKLLDLIAGLRTDHRPKTEFHIGFAGGGLLQHTARLLADKLRRTKKPLPKTIFFHAMVARFDEDPATDPNSFFAYFTSGQPLPLAARFIGLMAPGVVKVETALQLKQTEGIKEAYSRKNEIDVVVTSAGAHWDKGCSGLHRMYKSKSKGDAEFLAHFKTEGCLGDLMWGPIGPGGPIKQEKGIRAMTLMDLDELPELIATGKWVFLVIGRCDTCHEPKGDILRTILDLDRHYITDLVCDSPSARSVTVSHGP